MLAYDVRRAGYYAGRSVLRGVEGRVDEGEVLVVAGPSGSGKTTLILGVTGIITNLLGGWVEGSVKLGEADPLDPRGFMLVPRYAGVVLQDPEKQLIMPTPLDEVLFTLENLGFGEGEAAEKARKVLKRFGLWGKSSMHVERLSGGEKRRLTFAASIVHEPRLLILDEPTSSVDPWGIREIRDFVKHARSRGSAIMVIEHKLKYFLDLADEIMVLRGGRAAAVMKGPPSDRELEKLEEMGIDARGPRVEEKRKSRGRRILSVRGLSVGYGDKPLIRNADFEVGEGEVVAIVGRNGCGKTTLLKTIEGALKPLEGEIVVYGRSVGRAKPREIFYVPQQPDYLFLGRSLRGELVKVSSKTGVEVRELSSLIPWYDEYMDLSPYRLSHGQRRWLSIIIAWGYRPRIILLDEPTTGLDYGLFKELKTLVEELASRGTAFLVSTHDPRVVGEMADRALLVENGGIREVDRAWMVGFLEREAGVRS